jgi:hypothetical protein
MLQLKDVPLWIHNDFNKHSSSHPTHNTRSYCAQVHDMAASLRSLGEKVSAMQAAHAAETARADSEIGSLREQVHTLTRDNGAAKSALERSTAAQESSSVDREKMVAALALKERDLREVCTPWILAMVLFRGGGTSPNCLPYICYHCHPMVELQRRADVRASVQNPVKHYELESMLPERSQPRI